MSDPASGNGHGGDRAVLAFRRRDEPASQLAAQAGAVAAACHAMAVRFHRAGRLVVFGIGAASTDAQHVAVEFVHPVIVGKRALPAISLTADVATVTGVAARDGMDAIFAHQIRYLAAPGDIALGISADGHCPSVRAGLAEARARGLLTIALAGGDGGALAGCTGRGPPAAGSWRGPARGQGTAGDHLPRALGAGTRVLRAAGRAGPRRDRVSPGRRG